MCISRRGGGREKGEGGREGEGLYRQQTEEVDDTGQERAHFSLSLTSDYTLRKTSLFFS